jgi:nitroreductase
MNVEQLLTSTRSARRTLDLSRPVEPVEIADCLQVALQAANGSNHQSWRGVVVSDARLRGAIADLYRESYLQMTGGAMVSDLLPQDDFGRLMSSTEWLVEHLRDVPLHVIPCYEPYLPEFGDGDAAFQTATLYGSIFPAVWNFQLALHTKGLGTCITTMHLLRQAEVGALLNIPSTYVQGCLLPVAMLLPGRRFRPAPRRSLQEVAVVDAFDGPPVDNAAVRDRT